jgi:hypothetical protein
MDLRPIIWEDTLFRFPSPVSTAGISFPFHQVFEFSVGLFGVHNFINNVFFSFMGDNRWGRVWEFLGRVLCGCKGREEYFVENRADLLLVCREFELIQ